MIPTLSRQRVVYFADCLGLLLQVIIKWRGKPVFIRHRTEQEINEANKVNVQSLRDPQDDADRVKKPEWLVMLGMYNNEPMGNYRKLAGEHGG